MIGQKKVLVLNRNWQAVGVVSLPRAITMLFSEYENSEPKARIIDCTDKTLTSLSWDDWAKMTPRTATATFYDNQTAWHCPLCDHDLHEQYDSLSKVRKCHGCNAHVKSENGEFVFEEDSIFTQKTIFRVPTVIVLSRYDRLPSQKIHFSRRTIYRRDHNTCQYCGQKLPTEELNIDHVAPRAYGGLTTWENCVLACVKCNSQKADRTPEQAVRGKGQKDYDPVRCPNGWKGPSPMKLIRQPKKPKFNLFKGDYRVKDWEDFLGKAYWLTELENDEK